MERGIPAGIDVMSRHKAPTTLSRRLGLCGAEIVNPLKHFSYVSTLELVLASTATPANKLQHLGVIRKSIKRSDIRTELVNSLTSVLSIFEDRLLLPLKRMSRPH